ncbi:MAG: type II toxin-antitoxin system VapC family toxin [Paludibacter sp.]|jgi:PIN domain nuclease of toxin-antitoxin system|nr:type II toxin-antitoxin system VapC family toxin [Paludibacter sp.]
MRYYIDTNIIINLAIDDYISEDVRAIMDDYSNLIYVSSECVREFIQLEQAGSIAWIKKPKNFDIFNFIKNEWGFTIKYIAEEHLQTFAALPLFDDHKDPFDRLIIAQAMTEQIPIISNDGKFKKYRKLGLEFILNRRN